MLAWKHDAQKQCLPIEGDKRINLTLFVSKLLPGLPEACQSSHEIERQVLHALQLLKAYMGFMRLNP